MVEKMRYGLVISCEEYNEYCNIPYCNNDALLIYDVLCEFCDYKRNEDSFQVIQFVKNTGFDVKYFYSLINSIKKEIQCGDTFLFYFAGHGKVYQNHGYLVLPDTKDDCLADTAISLKDLSELLKIEGCQTFLFLDACHAGIGARGAESKFSLKEIEGNTSVCILASCSELEESYPDEDNEQGVFTYNLADAIRFAEPNNDLLVPNLHTIVCENMHQWCEYHGKTQTPTLTGNMVGIQCFATRNDKIYEYDRERLRQNFESGNIEMKELIVKDKDSLPIYKKPLWESNCGLVLPPSAGVKDIVPLAKQLRSREIESIKINYEHENYETAAEFIWSRSIALLRSRILALGTQFVSEMVGVYNLDYINELPTFEVINIAHELGFIDKTGRMRLNESAVLVNHYLGRDLNAYDLMPHNECETVIRSCVQYILANDDNTYKTSYAGFRDRLTQTNYSDNNQWLEVVKASPYFYQKTTMRTLINLLSSTEGAEYQTVEANFCAIMPIIWEYLKSDDKYFIGTSYSLADNNGNESLKSSYSKVLRSVQGFDYVPENLRSLSFIEAAKQVKEVHYGIDNFYNEPSAIKRLNEMGTRIPMPALNECIGATLLVYIGNVYGYSWAAERDALSVLGKLTKQDWEYYIEKCMIYDMDLLPQIIAGGERTKRWCGLACSQKLSELEFSDKRIKDFITYAAQGDAQGVMRIGQLIMRSNEN